LNTFFQDDEKEPQTEDTSSIDTNINDIEFEEEINIDDIQNKVQEQIDQSAFGNNQADAEKTDLESSESTALESDIKKYVIYIDIENVSFMESLSKDERKNIINKILREQNELSIKTKKENARKKFINHTIFAIVIFIIFFPILFVYINKATQISIDNYKQAKKNFSKLYKEHGKIKMKNENTIKSIKY
jgi:hypothetical protein